jgi:hypothetical protein
VIGNLPGEMTRLTCRGLAVLYWGVSIQRFGNEAMAETKCRLRRIFAPSAHRQSIDGSPRFANGMLIKETLFCFPQEHLERRMR